MFLKIVRNVLFFFFIVCIAIPLISNAWLFVCLFVVVHCQFTHYSVKCIGESYAVGERTSVQYLYLLVLFMTH